MAERGAVRFDYPDTWVAVPDETSISFYDREPPDENCRLTVSVMQLGAVGGRAPRLSILLESMLQGEEPVGTNGPIQEVRVGEIDVAWRELRFIDTALGREARSRTGVARQGTLQCLLTFDYWADAAERCVWAWATVLETLALDRSITGARPDEV